MSDYERDVLELGAQVAAGLAIETGDAALVIYVRCVTASYRRWKARRRWPV